MIYSLAYLFAFLLSMNSSVCLTQMKNIRAEKLLNC